jgi:hypothetical protein
VQWADWTARRQAPGEGTLGSPAGDRFVG